ncbi:TcmI family type II polyketide cyclase [Nocardia terpenica]|uniref:TcmI family type II polyketide cyclase n=1 Tax=Nocardia terpenica TaxID=455432 RepID=A0A6G9YYP8_9NOCA|nr:TcmI family type II polyketide cyclase [Nocardia terpenica]QIS18469.1 TcmI family type II polyketide cyclase [Nocardia terpenica]
MFTTLIIAKFQRPDLNTISELFGEFDKTDMPERMGTLRRQLFNFHDLYIHAQDFAEDHGPEQVENARKDPRFVKISEDLLQFFDPYAPGWTGPKDAMASCFYRWQQ